ncbi:WxcM-like, C-terminal [Epilithonimonas bovis DSM 19482]|jgi:oxalate decarboxylase/phosphoglucose isomerase-like protein (cupin superfamily)|uniref:WxcM-like, C-terminal n=1 Tax=Epilithonimonas bovis DSM 19482 TaxID=1121284 RepID=A0A1U7PUW0_9FLAO|nr:FdtA/QdtA family cupin domain-containing protein [Epilithonimonas bovis]QIY84500.1 WxcM-like domain-containing protein [Chryseobacterium sp. NEB161]SIT96679.1 WxcM-like, C-terminal [Epilithonimonas bovis DSM 19482]
MIINLPKIEDPRGNLSVIENETIPFPIKRVYYLYDVPSGTERGGHAHKEQEAFIIAVSGSFDVILNDGQQKRVYTLNMPNQGLYVPKMTWRELKNFSSGAVCLVISPAVYDEEDYIRDYEEFISYLK